MRGRWSAPGSCRFQSWFLALVVGLVGSAHATMSVQAPSQAEWYGVFEVTISRDDAPYPNPWEGVQATCTLVAPSGRRFVIDGFYYDVDTWKVRFAPGERGRYSWTLQMDGDTASGSFDTVDSGNEGFIRRHSTNPYRFVYERTGRLYNALGFSTGCVNDPVRAWLDERQVPLQQYLDAMVGETGTNLFRMSIANGGYAIWQTLSASGNTYRVNEGKWVDTWCQELRRRGVRMYIDFTGFGWRNARNILTDVETVRRYIRYAMARYGAYVDFWELTNEYPVSSAWISSLAQYVKQIDPYARPVSVSWARPDHPDIDMNTPHIYFTASPDVWDTLMKDRIENGIASEGAFRKAAWPKPYIAEELGNAFGNPAWDPLSARRSRVMIWTTFFCEGHCILWEQNWNRLADGGLYFDRPTRQGFGILQSFTGRIGPDIVIGRTATTAQPVRVYELRDQTSLYLYLIQANPNSPTRGVSVQADVPAAGTAQWIDPGTGRILREAAVSAGSQSLPAPDFSHELALRVEPDQVGGNRRPRVDAGAATSVTLPRGGQLQGIVTDDGASTTRWRLLSGPDAATIANPASLVTTVGFATPGTYVFELAANDGSLVASATTTVTVLPDPTQPGQIEMAAEGFFAQEGQPSASIRVVRSGGSAGTASARLQSIDGSARGGVDFARTDVTLTWADGDASDRVIAIAITNDVAQNGARTFDVALSAISGATPGRLTRVPVVLHDDDLPLATGLSGLWSFDDGTARDASGNGNDGQVLGAVAESAGRINAAMRFDGVDDSVRVGDAPTLNPSTAMTVSAWIRPSALGGIVLAKGNLGSQFQLRVFNFSARFAVNNQANDAFYPQYFQLGRWYHIAGVYDGAFLHVYVDGVEIGTPQRYSVPIAATTTPFEIGKRSGSVTNPYAGAIDEVRLYRRALSPSEVRALLGASSTPPPPATRFVLYAEQAASTGTWAGTRVERVPGWGTVVQEVQGQGAPEGTAFFRVSGNQCWQRVDLTWFTVRDLSAFAGGELRFRIRATSGLVTTQGVFVALGDRSLPWYDPRSPQSIGRTRGRVDLSDRAWHEVVLPLTASTLNLTRANSVRIQSAIPYNATGQGASVGPWSFEIDEVQFVVRR